MVWFFKINRVMWLEFGWTFKQLQILNFNFFLNHHHNSMMKNAMMALLIESHWWVYVLSFFFNFVNYKSPHHCITSITTTNYCPMAAHTLHLTLPSPQPNYGPMAICTLHFTPTTAQQPSMHSPHTITINYSSMATHTIHHYCLKPSTPHYRGSKCIDVHKVIFSCFSLLY